MATLYIDNTNTSGDLTSVTGWSFVNGSATVTCPGAEGDANNEIADDDYVRPEGGVQWYKVTARAEDGDSITIVPVFQQGNVGPVACNYSDISVSDGTDWGAVSNKAWVHPALATTDTLRPAGDIVNMRANQVHVLAGRDLIADEDGTMVAMIQLRGCTNTAGGNDPWEDNDDTHVIFDFSDTSFQCYWNADLCWQFENIDFIQSADGNGVLRISNFKFVKIIDCVFRDCVDRGIFPANGRIEVYDSSFYSNKYHSIVLLSCSAAFYNCIFDGGLETTNHGMYIDSCSFYLEDCSFGVTTAHDDRDIYITKPSVGNARRCIFNTGVEFFIVAAAVGSCLKSEDHDQVIGAHKSYFYNGIIEKEITEVRDGGASSSIKATPNSNCSVYYPLTLMEWEEQGVPAAEQTRGVAIKVTTNPGSYPANTEFYLEAEYYDHGVNDTVATAVSTAVLAANDTWVWFPVVFTPAQVQKVRYKIYLATKENAESYYIDNQLYDADPT